MFETLKGLFEKKAIGDKRGYSYRGATYGQGDLVDGNINLYYNLFRSNTDLRRCIEELYQASGKDGFKIYKYEGKEEIELEDPLYLTDSLEFGEGFLSLKAKIVRDLQISGNVFILNILNVSGQIIGYQVLDPRTMRIVANKYGEIIGYIQRVRGETATYGIDEIFHFKDMIDHDNEIMGISKIETLCYDIMADKEAGRSNYSFFKNNAIPSTIIYLDNDMDEAEQKIALEQLKNQFSGGENKHKVSASSGIKDVKVIGQSMKDMEFLALRGFTTERICSALGVPKTILGYSDNINFSTSDNQYRKYIEYTIRPLEKQLEYIFTTLLLQIDENIEFEFEDKNEFDLNEKVTRNEKLFNIGVKTINEIRADLGMIKVEDENADKLILKSGYTYLDDVGVDLVSPLNTIPVNE